MKLGIIGLAKSGKATVFEALTKQPLDMSHKKENITCAIRVPDERIDILSNIYTPKKTTYAQITYFLPGATDRDKETSAMQEAANKVRDCDALIHVVRNFNIFGGQAPDPYADFKTLNDEMMLADLMVVEKRLERLELDKKRGKNIDLEEGSLLSQCLENLEKEIPLRKCPDLVSTSSLKGYAFLSLKPMLVLFNNEDEDDNIPKTSDGPPFNEPGMTIRGKLEQELVQMSDKDAADFLLEFNIKTSAMDRVIKKSYQLLGLISFFTVGTDEVKAWTIKENTSAVNAADVIHSDIKKGFIRAEVLSYEEFIRAGSHHEAKKRGTLKLEGKTYEVQDGDIINFRFNV
jgi:GTP-binding protein YchF